MPTPVILSGAEYLALPRNPQTWLLEPFIPVGGASLVYGDPKVGKSFAAIQMAVCLSRGESWLGFKVPKPSPGVYLQMDTPRSLWLDRLDALRDSGVAVDCINYADRDSVNLMPFDVLDREHFTLLYEAFRKMKPEWVIIDTIREIHEEDENQSKEMKKVMAALTAMTQPAALILVAHAKKPSLDGAPSTINDVRGSSYIAGKVDSILRFTKKSLYYEGRACEEGKLNLTRSANLLWAPSNLSSDLAMEATDESSDTEYGQAKEMAELTGKTLEACRSYIRRQKSHKSDQ